MTSRAHLQRGTAENDTIILSERSNLTQANIFETDLTRRLFRALRKSINPQRPQPQPQHEPQPQPQDNIISVPLKRKGSYWVAQSTIGSKTFNLMIDTASPCFWIKSLPRSSNSGRLRRFYCPNRYRGRPTINGQVFENSMTMGNKHWRKVEFAVPDKTNSVEGTPYDGVLGLSLPATRVAFDVAEDMHFVRRLRTEFTPFFALHLAPTGSKLHIGGPRSDYYVGNIEFHNVKKDSGRWQIGLAVITVTVGTKSHSVSGIETVFDSSVEEIFGPDEEVLKIYQALRGDETSDLTFPCGLQPVVTFKWEGGASWPIDPKQFILGQKHGTTSCVGAIKGGTIKGRTIKGGPDVWILGTRFITSVYSIYDASENKPRLGIAQLPLDLVPPPPYESPPTYEESQAAERV